MPRQRIASALVVASLVALGSFASDATAATTPVPLGTVASFAVIGGATVTSAGVSTLTGDLGVSPGTAVTGFPPGTITGTLYGGGPVAAQAQADLATAYGNAVGRTDTAAPIATDLGGLTLSPGVYSAAAAAMTLGAGSTLTLDGQGDPNAVFIIRAGSTLITGANSAVALIRGAQACNVFWAVGSSATLGATSVLRGTMLTSVSISSGDGVTIDGRMLAHSGAVTLINDTATVPRCVGPLTSTTPAIAPFSVRLTGVIQTVNTTLGAWNVSDGRGTDAGYSVTVAASAPTVNNSSAAAGTGGSITLTPATATAATGNTATTGPVAASPQTLSSTPATIENAAAGTGQGEWDFAADSGSTESVKIKIPGNAGAGSYLSTLTFTTAPPVG